MRYPRLLLPPGLLLGGRQSTGAPPAAPTDHIAQEGSATEPAAAEVSDMAATAQATPVLDTADLAPQPTQKRPQLYAAAFSHME